MSARPRHLFDYDREYGAPYELVPVELDPAAHAVPGAVSECILVDTLHDGAAIPREYRFRPDGSARIDAAELDRTYVQERDWGANLVAHKLASALGLEGYCRVGVARVLLEFNRFPGNTPRSVRDPADRLAINPPFTHQLRHSEKMRLLEDYYDGISQLMEPAITGKLLKIAVHTYDEHNASLTQRPDVSVVSRPHVYQHENRMTYGLFDPLYPDVLGESTCSRSLLHRMSLNLERGGFRVGHNHPYLLPEGSIEVRSQVWFFFRFLRRRFEREFPESRGQPDFEMVWNLLLNTNLRLAESDALQGYLHRFRKVSGDNRERFRSARKAYERVRRFLRDSSVVSDYRRSPDRPSSLALEVRKDLLCQFDSETGMPLPMRPETEETATAIARVVAAAIATHFEVDRRQPIAAPLRSEPA